MQTVELQTPTGLSQIFLGGKLEQLPALAAQRRMMIVTDETVSALYRDQFPSVPVFPIPPGEASKTLPQAQRLYEWLLAQAADRQTLLVGVGGGVVCDLTGFVASTFMRGMPCGYVASTLLAQIDASVGGKTGVNFGGLKNIVGTFSQPEFVICDTDLLASLPDDELQNGFAEAIKHGLIADADLFAFMLDQAEDALSLSAAAIERIVGDSVRLKARIVAADEREGGQRRLLNFGHTLGHAIEKVFGISHGRAVALGMLRATSASEKRGLVTAAQSEPVRQILCAYHLLPESATHPTTALLNGPVDARTRQALIEAMGSDKKKQSHEIALVLLAGVGHAVISREPIRACEELLP